jgi:shikimate dehydrogenase
VIRTIPTLCGSVSGNPSPLGARVHGAGYRALSLDYTYLAMGAETLAPVVALVRELGFRGLGVSMPFKQEILGFLDDATPEVRAIGACNTVVNDGGRLTGHNTDWSGALAAVDEVFPKPVERAVLIGAGGAARAIAYGLKARGTAVFVSARDEGKRTNLVAALGLAGALPIERQGDAEATLVVNTTPLADAASPVALAAHRGAQVLLDVVFRPRETPLAAAARQRGWAVAPGHRMLLHQALRQFELYTKHAPPVAEMEQALAEGLSRV